MAKTPAAKKKAVSPKAAKAKAPPLSVDGLLRQLESMGNEKTRANNAKHGAGDNQFGVKHGDLRVLANKIKANHELALALWKTDNVDAQLLAALLMKASQLSASEMERLVRSVASEHVAEWLHSYVLKEHADKEALRQKWMTAADPWAARAAWRLTAGRVIKSPDGLDPAALLDRIEAEMAAAHPLIQWTMNMCLAEIGIRFPDHRKRALAIGEKLGIYRDYPVSKGCTSPFAPIWINAMVGRQKGMGSK